MLSPSLLQQAQPRPLTPVRHLLLLSHQRRRPSPGQLVLQQRGRRTMMEREAARRHAVVGADAGNGRRQNRCFRQRQRCSARTVLLTARRSYIRCTHRQWCCRWHQRRQYTYLLKERPRLLLPCPARTFRTQLPPWIRLLLRTCPPQRCWRPSRRCWMDTPFVLHRRRRSSSKRLCPSYLACRRLWLICSSRTQETD